jgi:hypothetical protein
MAEQEVRIGGTREGVLIRVTDRQFPDAFDFDDGNWLNTPIQIRVGHFQGELPAQLRADELQSFRSALEKMDKTVSGEAVLKSLDGWLTLSVKCEASGTLSVTGIADDRPGIGNRLHFMVDGMDQSFLSAIIEQLRDIESSYPVRGQ